MNKDHFARTFGFNDYEEMVEISSLVLNEDNSNLYVTKLPDGHFLAWDSSEIADDRVEVFLSIDEAKNYLLEQSAVD